MSPVDRRRRRARRRSPRRSPGMAFVAARPARRAGRARLVRVVDVDAVGRADVRHARAGARALRDGGARAAARRPVPLRRRAHAPRRSPTRRPPTSRRTRCSRRCSAASTSCSMRRAGSRAAWRWATRSSSSTPTSSACGTSFATGVDLSENGQAMDAFLTNEPGKHFLGTAHTLANFETAFYRSPDRRQLELRAVGERGREGRRASARTRSGSGRSPSTRRRRSTTRSTRSSASGSSGGRRRSPTRASDGDHGLEPHDARHRAPAAAPLRGDPARWASRSRCWPTFLGRSP